MPVLAPCFLNMQTSPPQQSSLAHIDSSNILQFTSHCYAEESTKRVKGGLHHPDTWVCKRSLSLLSDPDHSLGWGLLVKQMKGNHYISFIDPGTVSQT